MITTMAKPLVFTTTADLVAWMQDDGINEVVLDKLAPEPAATGAVPDVVSFRWRVFDPGLVRPHELVASGVTAWSLSSKRDRKTAIGISVDDDGDGVRLQMHVPGLLTLHCAALAVTVGRTRKPTRAARPASDYGNYLIIRQGSVSMAAVLAGLGAPASAQVVYEGRVLDDDALAVLFVPNKHTMVHIVIDGVLWVELLVGPPIMPGEFRLTVIKRAIGDDDWDRATELAHHIGPSRVEAAWDFAGTDAAWMAEVGRKVTPRAKHTAKHDAPPEPERNHPDWSFYELVENGETVTIGCISCPKCSGEMEVRLTSSAPRQSVRCSAGCCGATASLPIDEAQLTRGPPR